MSVTSKSPAAVAREALAVAEEGLPRHWHKFSPQRFTVPQLFACLVLKAFFRTDCRGTAAILADLPDLRRELGLSRVPHFTTPQKNAARLPGVGPANDLLRRTVRRHLGAAPGRVPAVGLAAADSTGFEASQISP